MTSRSRLSRRTTLAAAALAPACLAACDVDPPRDDSGPGPSSAPPDADSVLVASVVGAIASAEAVIAAAALAAPALGRRLGPLAAAHSAHRALLADAAPQAASASPAPPEVDGAKNAVLAAVRRSEAGLQRAALRACVDASSGDLARVLASLAASTSQHLAALDDSTRGAA